MSWTNLVKGAIHQVKDTGSSAAIKPWLAKELADYGEVLDFKINSRERSAELHVLLKGEKDKLTVSIQEYELATSGDQDFIVVKRAHASREWVNAVLRKFVLDKKHRIPPQYSAMAKLVLKG